MLMMALKPRLELRPVVKPRVAVKTILIYVAKGFAITSFIITLEFIIYFNVNVSQEANASTDDITSLNTDLPTPDANLQSVPAGSLIIAMDNTWQLNSSSRFNLKAYGLIVTLLNNDVEVLWSIKAGKAKDGADFTAGSTRLFPSAVAASTKSFKAGPFIIDVSDTAVAGPIIRTYNNALASTIRVNVYRLDSTKTIDIRYTLNHEPKIAVFSDGGNETIHTTYLVNAGIPSANYSVLSAANVNLTCYTFACEPHSTATGAVIDSIAEFVNSGGNFLAECKAINTYENATNGRFQTTLGITIVNTNISSQMSYPNPDLSFSQYDGAMNPNSGGSEQTWSLAAGSVYKNSCYDHIHGSTATTAVGASVSKAVSGVGGLVFYLGAHNYNGTSVIDINGQRMFLNAMLTPSNPYNCGFNLIMPQELVSFLAESTDGAVGLKWATASEVNTNYFEVERSADGSNYTMIGWVAAQGNSTVMSNYSLKDVNAPNGTLYYRLKMVDIDNSTTYSHIELVNNSKSPLLRVFPNPTADYLHVQTENISAGESFSVEIYSSLGSKKLCEFHVAAVPDENYTVDVSPLAPGSYLLKLTTQSSSQSVKWVKK